MSDAPPPPRAHPGTVGEVFTAFLRLGLTSFGGPVAHLAYFRETFVVRRRWLGDRAYADLVALCQFLPGPASSKVGMAIGLQRAGVLGLIAGWLAFTLPSAVLLVAFAFGVTALGDVSGAGWLQGFKAAAVAVVAQAVIGMARTLTPDATRATIAAGGMLVVLLLPGPLTQVGVIVAAAIAGLIVLRATPTPAGDEAPFHVRVPRWVGVACFAAYGLLLAVLPLLAATGDSTAGLIDAMYRSGALVFGGGHVVLPMLEAETVQTGLVGADEFLAGYGAAQAVPGPLFTFSAYLGMLAQTPPNWLLGAAIALIAIFVPGTLLLVGALPFWSRLRDAPRVRRALMGVNAGVVGLLAAALYDPVIVEGITSTPTFLVAALAWFALRVWKTPPWAVVVAAGLVGWAVL
ncbi:chromate efflux transporter [Gulosibacter faecalis]|uniref:Chromate efflux transporter n=1 Tax=Gulosibacter faecalis TaxID=272240 RepID=A0ABW5UZE2_9MICO|nr:chromate efflux transporter [Gulosibacter faecalis]